jgi:hypothetical protein
VNVQQSRGGGGSTLGWLALMFIGLKLGHVITWPWWIVLTPVWGPAGLVALILLAATVMALVEAWRDR